MHSNIEIVELDRAGRYLEQSCVADESHLPGEGIVVDFGDRVLGTIAKVDNQADHSFTPLSDMVENRSTNMIQKPVYDRSDYEDGVEM